MDQPPVQPDPDEPWLEMLDDPAPGDSPAPAPTPVSYHSGYQRDDEPTSRELVLGWCLWLLGSWMVTLLIDSAVPAVRWMVFAAVLGLMVLWPAVRLSQDARRRLHWASPLRQSAGQRVTSPATIRDESNVNDRRGALHPPLAPPSREGESDPQRRPNPLDATAMTPALILRDWLCLILVFQAVVWPLRITGRWPVTQAVWLDAAVAAWSLLTGLLIALGCRVRSGVARTAAMAACVGLLFGEPAAQAAISRGAEHGLWRPVNWPMRVSPVEALWAMTAGGDPLPWSGGPWGAVVVSVLLAGVLGWGALVMVNRISRQ